MNLNFKKANLMHDRKKDESGNDSLIAWRCARNTAILGAGSGTAYGLYQHLIVHRGFFPARLIVKECAAPALVVGFFAGASIGAIYSKAKIMMKSKPRDLAADTKSKMVSKPQ